jgi:Uri superfamily endonuclease
LGFGRPGAKTTRVVGKMALKTGTFCASTDDVPSLPGAYLLAIELAESVKVTLPGKPAAILAPGSYLYCGSAYGPGGLRARLRRHMRRGKIIRWHVDRLTGAGAVLGAWVFPREDECELAAALSPLPAPIAGFGSTDCTRCRAHLFEWPDAVPGATAGREREAELVGARVHSSARASVLR